MREKQNLGPQEPALGHLSVNVNLQPACKAFENGKYKVVKISVH